MPLDKSRIQGFGNDGANEKESSWFGGQSETKAKERRCPQGHPLLPWCAKPGWCDGCGGKIKSGDPVMDCRQCNYYLCRTCAPDEAESGTLWGSIPSLADMGAHPAVSSALDNVALSLGDVLDAATQDLSEMAGDLKSFVASAVGLEESDHEEQQKAAANRKIMEAVSPRSRQEATSAISDFCQRYPAARVRPTTQELEKLWAAISSLKPIALNSAFYDELSFTNGDTSWQPRLRVLYALEYLFRKDGMGKEVALSVFHQARSLVLHLTEVQQCAEKAQEVIKLLSSRKQDKAAEAKADAKAKPPAPTPPKEAPDLLDMSAPVAAAAPAVASAAAGLATVDLLGEPTVTSVTPAPATPSPAPSIQNLPAPAAPHEKLASSGCAGALAPSEALALALSSAPMAATATLPQDLDLLAPASPPKGRPSSGEVGNLCATASTSSGGGIAAMGGMVGLVAPDVKVMAKAQAPPPAAVGRAHYLGGPPIGGKLGNPYMPIPSTIDLPSQPPVDQFAFVSDITGIGDLAKPAK